MTPPVGGRTVKDLGMAAHMPLPSVMARQARSHAVTIAPHSLARRALARRRFWYWIQSYSPSAPPTTSAGAAACRGCEESDPARLGCGVPMSRRCPRSRALVASALAARSQVQAAGVVFAAACDGAGAFADAHALHKVKGGGVGNLGMPGGGCKAPLQNCGLGTPAIVEDIDDCLAGLRLAFFATFYPQTNGHTTSLSLSAASWFV